VSVICEPHKREGADDPAAGFTVGASASARAGVNFRLKARVKFRLSARVNRGNGKKGRANKNFGSGFGIEGGSEVETHSQNEGCHHLIK